MTKCWNILNSGRLFLEKKISYSFFSVEFNTNMKKVGLCTDTLKGAGSFLHSAFADVNIGRDLTN